MRRRSARSQLPVAIAAGFGLYVLRRKTSGLLQTLLVPAVVVLSTLLFQALRLMLPEESLAPLALPLPQGASSLVTLRLPTELQLGQASLDVALGEGASRVTPAPV